MSYTPPAGDALALDFVDAYSPPAGGALVLDFVPAAGGATQTVLGASAGDNVRYGTGSIRNNAVVARPASWYSEVIGAPTVELELPGFGPYGFVASTGFGNARIARLDAQFLAAFSRPSTLIFGAATAELIRIYVTAPPIASQLELGTPRVEDARKYVSVASLPRGSFGQPYVADYFQYIRPAGSDTGNAFGTSYADYRVRSLAATGIQPITPPAPIVELRRRDLRVEGIEPPYVPPPTVLRDAQWTYPPAIPPRIAFGVPAVVPRNATVRANGIPANELPRGAVVANRTQVAVVAQDFSSSVVSTLHTAANRNRVLGPPGFQSERVSNGQEYTYAITSPWRYVFADDILGKHQAVAKLEQPLIAEHNESFFRRATGRYLVFTFVEGAHRYVLSRGEYRNHLIHKFDRYTGEYLGNVTPRLRVSYYTVNAGGTTLTATNPDPYIYPDNEFVHLQDDPWFIGDDPSGVPTLSAFEETVVTPHFYVGGYLYVTVAPDTTDPIILFEATGWGTTTDTNGRPTLPLSIGAATGLRKIGPFTGGTVWSDVSAQFVAFSGEPGTGSDHAIPVAFPDRGDLFWQLATELKELDLTTMTVSSGAGNVSLPTQRSHPGPGSSSFVIGAWNYYLTASPYRFRRRDSTTGVDDPNFLVSFLNPASVPPPGLFYDGRWIWFAGQGASGDAFAIDPVSGRRTWDPQRQSTRITVYNDSRNLGPLGVDTSSFGATRISLRVRTLRPVPWESSFILQWNAVRNAARVLYPPGRATTFDAGVPSLVNANRTLVVPPVQEESRPQAALVAYRVRTVGHWFPSSSNYLPLPEVRFDPFPIAPAGIDSYRTGVPDVFERFNRCFPSSIPPRNQQVAEPTILNRNRVLRPDGNDLALYGRAVVQLLRRFVSPVYTGGSTFGRHAIADTDRVMPVPSIGAQAFVPTGLTVAYTSITPLTTRYLFVTPMPATDLSLPGFPRGLAVVGTPQVRPNSIFPASVPPFGSSSAFGAVVVRGNTIYPLPANTPDVGGARFGVVRVSGPQYVTQQGALSGRYGAVRLSPHTIWATDAVTLQTRENHPGPTFAPVDAATKAWIDPPYSGWVTEGAIPEVTLKNRRIYPEPLPRNPPATISSPGLPTVQTLNRRISPTPWRSSRIGIATLPLSPRRVFVTPYPSAPVYGNATVAFNGAVDGQLRIRLAGYGFQSSAILDEHFVASTIRYLLPAPFTYLYAAPDDERPQPPALGTPRVHPPEPLEVEGIAPPAISAEHAISWRVRWLETAGDDESELLYQWGPLTGRMSVRNVTTPTATVYPTQTIGSAGLTPELSFSLTTVYNHSHFVEPDCICPLGVQVPAVTHA